MSSQLNSNLLSLCSLTMNIPNLVSSLVTCLLVRDPSFNNLYKSFKSPLISWLSR